MSQTTVTYKCLNCGAGLVFNADNQHFCCDFCLSSFTERELLESAARESAERDERDEQEFRDSVDEYYCTSCGAQIIADKSTVSDFCYYCHNPIVLADKVSGVFRPSKIIPFKISREEAAEQFTRYAKKRWFVPRGYLSREHISKMSGVYYPFWVTDADTDSAMHALGKRVRSWRSGDYRYTETKRYDVYRRGSIHFEDITTSALSTEDKAMLEGVLPYPLDDYRDFAMPYLQGFVAKKRDIEREDIGNEVKGRMNSYATALLLRTANGYTSVEPTATDVAILTSHWEYSLMPIWILTYKKKKKTYVYAMNGSTGKVYGELPISVPKLILFALGIFAAAFLISFGLGWLFI